MNFEQAPSVNGSVKFWLRIENLGVLLVSVFAYMQLDLGLAKFLVLFLIPDIAFVAYLANPRIGAFCYNLTHSYLGAVLLLVSGWAVNSEAMISVGIIWIAHIGFDRALGFGLKYSAGFRYTHLGVLGTLK